MISVGDMERARLRLAMLVSALAEISGKEVTADFGDDTCVIYVEDGALHPLDTVTLPVDEQGARREAQRLIELDRAYAQFDAEDPPMPGIVVIGTWDFAWPKGAN